MSFQQKYKLEFIEMKLNENKERESLNQKLVVTSYLSQQDRILKLQMIEDINTLIFGYYRHSFWTNVDAKYVRSVLSTGQLFLKYTGKRRRKPQDRIIRVR